MIGGGLLAAAWLAATAATGQMPAAPPIVDPPPPVSTEMKDVLAWADKYLEVPGWRVLAVNPYGMLLASPDGVKLRAEGWAEADLRHEMFKPVEVGGKPMRSDLERWVVNCQDRRHALPRISLYTHNNLKDEFASRGSEEPKWLETGQGDEAAQAVEAMCKAVEGKKPPPPKPPGHP